MYNSGSSLGRERFEVLHQRDSQARQEENSCHFHKKYNHSVSFQSVFRTHLACSSVNESLLVTRCRKALLIAAHLGFASGVTCCSCSSTKSFGIHSGTERLEKERKRKETSHRFPAARRQKECEWKRTNVSKEELLKMTASTWTWEGLFGT
ncbi:hypothetical protein Y032_0009g750 [Ancylostoma ceylanicum]|uniref:Uncharacterized protein n=1 Tax=Ancylostoma ceylanicum TaxID=53326 RepID=A0A016VJ78_9BILA|nr:hypothetical protein Y032_0009g750 [Ancylostoma ceylanicum]